MAGCVMHGLCVQEDAWYAASSLVGSMASLGEAHIDGMGGMKLVKPLFLVLRRGGNQCKAAALRALQHLTTERACRAMTARVHLLPTPPCLYSLCSCCTTSHEFAGVTADQIIVCQVYCCHSRHWCCCWKECMPAAAELPVVMQPP